MEDYRDRFFDFDGPAAFEWGRYAVEVENAPGSNRWKNADFRDTQIGAMAREYGLTIATHNAKDFPLCSTIDPFEPHEELFGCGSRLGGLGLSFPSATLGLGRLARPPPRSFAPGHCSCFRVVVQVQSGGTFTLGVAQLHLWRCVSCHVICQSDGPFAAKAVLPPKMINDKIRPRCLH
jgi:hypothetical protein